MLHNNPFYGDIPESASGCMGQVSDCLGLAVCLQHGGLFALSKETHSHSAMRPCGDHKFHDMFSRCGLPCVGVVHVCVPCGLYPLCRVNLRVQAVLDRTCPSCGSVCNGGGHFMSIHSAFTSLRIVSASAIFPLSVGCEKGSPGFRAPGM